MNKFDNFEQRPLGQRPDSSFWQLTRHINLSKIDNGFIAHNALQNTAIKLSEQEWKLLTPFGEQQPETACPNSAFFSQVVDRKILLQGPDSLFLGKELLTLKASLLNMLGQQLDLRPEELKRLIELEGETTKDSTQSLLKTLEMAHGFVSVLIELNHETLTRLYDPKELLEEYRIGLMLLNLPRLLYQQLANDAQTSYRFDPELCMDFANLPETDESLEQQPCMPYASAWRAQRVQKDFPDGARVLVLGDDDLLSLALAPLGDYEITVAEIDPRIISVIEHGKERRQLDNITTVATDLRDGLPDTLRGRFNIVITDPPYSVDGMTAFLSSAQMAFKSDSGLCKLYISTNPGLLQDAKNFFKQMASRCFVIHRRHHNAIFYIIPPYILGDMLYECGQLGYPFECLEHLSRCPYIYADFFEAVHIQQPEEILKRSLNFVNSAE